MSNNVVESPCVRNCCLDEGDICMGCYRHIEEISQWSKASNADKQAIMDRVAERRKHLLGSNSLLGRRSIS